MHWPPLVLVLKMARTWTRYSMNHQIDERASVGKMWQTHYSDSLKAISVDMLSRGHTHDATPPFLYTMQRRRMTFIADLNFCSVKGETIKNDKMIARMWIGPKTHLGQWGKSIVVWGGREREGFLKQKCQSKTMIYIFFRL